MGKATHRTSDNARVLNTQYLIRLMGENPRGALQHDSALSDQGRMDDVVHAPLKCFRRMRM